MATQDTKSNLVRVLRSSDAPALSAKNLANNIDVSVKTVNRHLEQLEKEGQIATTQIGNAAAYYIPDEDLPTHKKPDHTCHRCGREANDFNDIAKVEVDRYFETRSDSGTPNFYVLCRFCYVDLVSWLFGDDTSMGEYIRVHTWNIPEDQLQEVREDPAVPTAPKEEHQKVLDRNQREVFRRIEELEDGREFDDGVPKEEILDGGGLPELSRAEAREALQYLVKNGFVYELKYGQYEIAK